MKRQPSYLKLSKRERQIMDALYRLQEGSAAEVLEALESPPSYSAVRAKLRILEEKGYVSHRHQGRRYLYRPRVSHETARDSAISHLVRTFFGGSVESAVSALLRRSEVSEADLDRLSRLLEQVKEAKQDE